MASARCRLDDERRDRTLPPARRAAPRRGPPGRRGRARRPAVGHRCRSHLESRSPERNRSWISAGFGFVAVSLDEGLVEVLFPRTHAAHVHGDPRAYLVPAGGEVVAERGDDGRSHPEVARCRTERIAPGVSSTGAGSTGRGGARRRPRRPSRCSSVRARRRRSGCPGRPAGSSGAAVPDPRRPGRGRAPSTRCPRGRRARRPSARAHGAGWRVVAGRRPTARRNAVPCHPSTTWGPDTAEAERATAPPDNCWSVSAVIAVAPGVRAQICAIAVTRASDGWWWRPGRRAG